MGYYSFEWAARVQDRWAKRDPRVMIFIDRMVSWAAESNVAEPARYVYMRLAYWLQRSKGRTEWTRIKASVGQPINWRPIYNEFIAPPAVLEKFLAKRHSEETTIHL
jgi:hypothetical protein